MSNIGKYEIESKIGHGGMGDVYRAFDPTVRRYVAIKVLKVEGDADLLNRFHLEATAAGNLNHPNIVTIHDYGEHEGQPYLVMEFLEGEDLQRSLDSGRKFDLVEIADVMSQVADALECAHQHGVIHRDIKPANIMLLARGGVKLMDFGIARLTNSNTQQTKTGYLIGTPLYMSPEQFQNRELDARVDIWAYGLIYYQLLANKHPFQVPDQLATMYNIAHTPAPPICTLNCEVPEALGQIVDKCLVKDRDQRFRTMEDLRFEAFPVLQDLTKQQATRMVGEARNLVAAGKLEAAQALVRRVLDLDPGDRAAHTLRKTIAEELQRRSVRPQIESLCASAEQQMATRQFMKAVELYETALKLDPTLATARRRADEARALLDRDKRTSELLDEAQRELNQGDLSDAYRNAAELLRVNPEHAEGTRLLESIQAEIERRERSRRLEEGLANARNLVRLRSFDEAIPALTDLLLEFPGTSELSQLLRQAEAAREQELLQRRMQSELNGARELLKHHRFEDAIRTLEPLTAEFPREPEFGQLLAYAHEEWKVKQRAEALARLKNHITQLQGEERFDEALHFLDRSLAEYPGEAELLRLSQTIAAARKDAERRASLQETVNQIAAKQRVGELPEALRIADTALRQFGPESSLLQLREQIDGDWQAAQRSIALAQAIEEGRKLLGRCDWEHAVSHFRFVAKQYPGEKEPKALLAQAEEALKRDERERLEKEALAQAVVLENQGKPEAALAAIEAALRQYSDSTLLLPLRARLQRQLEESRQAREREAKLEETRRKALDEQQRRAREMEKVAHAINEAVSARNFGQALKLSRAAAKDYPGEGRFSELPGEIERLQRDTKVEECLANAYAAIGRGELDKAEKLLGEAHKADPNHHGIKGAADDLEKERARKAELKRITKIPENKPFDKKTGPKLPDHGAPTAFPLKWVAAGAAVALVLGGLYFFAVARGPRAPAPVPLQVSPASVAMEFTEGGGAPPSVEVSLQGRAGAEFYLKPSDPWISASPLDGTLPAKVMLSARTSGLAAGPHDGAVEVISGSQTGRVAVVLTVKPAPAPPPIRSGEIPPQLSVSPEFLSFEYPQGSPDSAPRSLFISGTGGPVSFEASARDRWVSVTPQQGTAPGKIVVTVHPAGLKPGKHVGQVTVTSAGSQPPQKVIYLSVTVPEPKVVSPPPQKDNTPAAVTPSAGAVNPPPISPTAPPPAPPAASPQAATGFYLGRREGDLYWTGTLAPGAKVVLSPKGVSDGGGHADGNMIPAGRDFAATVNTPRVQAVPSVSGLTLINTSADPVEAIRVHWKVK